MLTLIIFLYSYFVLIIIASESDKNIFLCKNCGHSLANVNDFIYKKSPMSLQIWNDSSLFHNHNDPKSMYKNYENHTLKHESMPNSATIQLLRNPHGNTFEVVTLRKADFFLLNSSKSLQDTWFPNYKWTIGLCPHCMVHIGWYFESITGQDGFFAIILDKLLNSHVADTLIFEPKFKAA
jgi:hypothetical protein